MHEDLSEEHVDEELVVVPPGTSRGPGELMLRGAAEEAMEVAAGALHFVGDGLPVNPFRISHSL